MCNTAHDDGRTPGGDVARSLISFICFFSSFLFNYHYFNNFSAFTREIRVRADTITIRPVNYFEPTVHGV